ncbi:MAG: carboxypeptidase-like regulatory domain-containing protein [Bacteroidota bacterium]
MIVPALPYSSRTIVCLFLYGFILCQFSFAQALLTSRSSSFHTYIFRLTEEEASSLYTNGIEESYLHSLQDSFLTDSGLTKSLPRGHYLFAHIELNQLILELHTVSQLQFQIIDNQRDLILVVHDSVGNIIPDAEVLISNKQIPFDSHLQAYRLAKSRKEGLLRITYQGYTDIYHVSAEKGAATLKTVLRSIVFTIPIRWIWRPPVQFVRGIAGSIGSGYGKGWIGSLVRLFNGSAAYNALYKYENRKDLAYGESSYLITNKPIYRPGDTVRVKAFVMKKKGRKLRRNVPLTLIGPFGQHRSSRFLAKLSPYRAGAYTYEFVLHDSLNLQLDQGYTLSMDTWFDYTLIQTSFRFEDYELNQAEFSATRAKQLHQRGEQQTLSLQVTDANQHNLPGSEASITVIPRKVEAWKDKQVFLADTLWQHEQRLDPIGPTSIQLPDSIFPEIKLDYLIKIELFTADREKKTFELSATFDNESDKLLLTYDADSLKAQFFNQNREAPRNAVLQALDHNEKVIMEESLSLPSSRPINPTAAHYRLVSGSLSVEADGASLVRVQSERGPDSLRILVQNPRRLPLWYHLYHQQKEIARGSSDSMDFHIRTKNQKIYSLSLSYLWKGNIHKEEYRIPYHPYAASLEFIHPARIFPGQEVEMVINAQTANRKPIAGLDIMAYGISSQFKDGPPPPLSSHLPSNKERKFYNQFRNTWTGRYKKTEALEYDSWNHAHRLDSISMFQFLYPKTGIYQFSLDAPDSITQFSPYVVNAEGALDPVHIIYVDQIPVFFRGTKGWSSYSIPVDSGYHHLGLRTHRYTVELDSLYIPYGKKLILSASTFYSHPHKTVIGMSPTLDAREVRHLRRFFVPIRSENLPPFSYVKQGQRIHLLKGLPHAFNRWDALYGPFLPDSMFLHAPGKFRIQVEFEPNYQYEFRKQFVKLSPFPRQSRIHTSYFPESLNVLTEQKAFGSFAHTEAAILEAWEEQVFMNNIAHIKYDNPTHTEPGHGVLHIAFSDSHSLPPKALILVRPDSTGFLRNIRPATRSIHQLGVGTYELWMFPSAEHYYRFDSLVVKADGINFYELMQDSLLAVDSLMKRMFDLSTSRLLDSTEQINNRLELQKTLTNSQSAYKGQDGKMIYGTILDLDGTPLIGASVLIKGTTIGTLTNNDGSFGIRMPREGKLVVSYVGYATQDVEVSGRSSVDVRLSSDLTLEEVVVTRLERRSGRKKAETVHSDLTQSLQKRPEVSLVSDSLGHVLRIRGISSHTAAPPLYVIDGVPYAKGMLSLEALKLRPEDFANIQVLKDSSMIGIYGSRAANGVILVETKSGAGSRIPLAIAEDNAVPLSLPMEASSLRSNFRDDAFWQPRLTTNRDGKATFSVRFPDDIAKWKVFAIGMGKGKYLGQTSSIIQAYKPLQARLSLPRFLIEGDQSFAIGKIQNFLGDTVRLNQAFVVGDNEPIQKQMSLSISRLDTISFTAPSNDSLQITFQIKEKDGYEDGEQRNIPIYPKGSQETEGQYLYLTGDTSLDLTIDQTKGLVRLQAESTPLDKLRTEIKQLRAYPYACNEQAASKLKALLWDQQIALQVGESFPHKRSVQKLIRRLLKAQRADRYWGWWPEGNRQLWITSHVVDALLLASESDYHLDFHAWELQRSLTHQLQKTPVWSHLTILELMHRMEQRADLSTVRKIVEGLEQDRTLSIHQHLSLLRTKQLYDLPYTLDSLWQDRQISPRQHWYWGNKSNRDLHTNQTMTTLLAYRILKDAKVGRDSLQRVQNYLLENRGTNTYHTASVLAHILPDILTDSSKIRPPQLRINGQLITRFPLDSLLDASSPVHIAKTGTAPIYASISQSYLDPAPMVKGDNIHISSWMSRGGDSLQQLQAGKEIKLNIQLDLEQDADYLMLEIPIPAGCDYVTKKVSKQAGEVYREFWKHKTAIFCENLPAGSYRYEIKLLPRYAGRYTVNPPRAVEMYFPVFEARGSTKSILITP